MKNLAWIAFWLLTGCVLCGTMGCMNSQKIKLVTDITPDGKVTYHTEYVAEF